VALTFHRTRSRAAFPAWVLLLPIGAGVVAWLMARKKQPAPSSASSSTSSGARLPAPLPPAPASSPLPRPAAIASTWVTPAKGRAYEPLFLQASARYDLPPGLLSRQASRESGYNPTARSSAGAVGIMQIIPKWHPEVGEAGALDPARAIPYAAKLLREYRDRFGSWSLALAAYNAGPTIVAKLGVVPPYKETRDYIAAILPDVGISEPGVRYA